MANRSSFDKHVWNRHHSRNYNSFEKSRRMVFKTESIQQPPSDSEWNVTLLPWSPVGATPLLQVPQRPQVESTGRRNWTDVWSLLLPHRLWKQVCSKAGIDSHRDLMAHFRPND